MPSADTAMADARAEPVINEALIAQFRQRKSSLLERLINAYLDEAPRFFQGIRSGVEAKDFDAVRLHSHALKSCSYNLGAVRLSKLCQAMENEALERNESNIERLLAAMGPEKFEAEEALKGELMALRNTGRRA